MQNNNVSPVRPAKSSEASREGGRGMNTFKKLVIACLLLGAFAAGSFFVYRTAIMAQGPIYEFDEQRDTQDILNLFKTDYYWLVEGEYDAAAMLKYRAPNGSPYKKGQMHIKVLRHNNEFVGFAAYYKKLGSDWSFNFIALDSKFRGKGFAQQLMRYAIDDMKRLGAKKITLVTRTTNTSAQKLYGRIGFVETYRNVGYVYFEYTLK